MTRKRREPAFETVETEYGRLRAVPRRVRWPGGHESIVLELSPDEMKKLPAGAIRADVSKQSFGLGGPHLYYVDLERRCRSCGASFVFSAKEQQYWYEVLGFFVDSTAVDCPRCRAEARAARAAQARYRDAAAAAGDEVPSLMELAAATLDYRLLGGRGDLNRGIAAARRARRLDPRAVDSLYFEARLQEAAGRVEKARELLERFVEVRGGQRELKREARKLLRAGLGPGKPSGASS